MEKCKNALEVARLLHLLPETIAFIAQISTEERLAALVAFFKNDASKKKGKKIGHWRLLGLIETAAPDKATFSRICLQLWRETPKKGLDPMTRDEMVKEILRLWAGTKDEAEATRVWRFVLNKVNANYTSRLLNSELLGQVSYQRLVAAYTATFATLPTASVSLRQLLTELAVELAKRIRPEHFAFFLVMLETATPPDP